MLDTEQYEDDSTLLPQGKTNEKAAEVDSYVTKNKVWMTVTLIAMVIICIVPSIVLGLLGSLVRKAGFNYGIEFYVVWMFTTIIYTAKFIGNSDAFYYKVYQDYGLFLWICSMVGLVLHIVYLLATFIFNLSLYTAQGVGVAEAGFLPTSLQTVVFLIWKTPVLAHTIIAICVLSIGTTLYIVLSFVLLGLSTAIKNKTWRYADSIHKNNQGKKKGDKLEVDTLLETAKVHMGMFFYKRSLVHQFISVFSMFYELSAGLACGIGVLLWSIRMALPREIEVLMPAPAATFLVIGGIIMACFLRYYSDLTRMGRGRWPVVVLMITVSVLHLVGLVIYFSIVMPISSTVCGYVFCSPAFNSTFFQGILANVPYGTMMGTVWLFAGICFIQIFVAVLLVVMFVVLAIFSKNKKKVD